MADIRLRSDDPDPSPIQRCLNAWHQVLTGDRAALHDLIADDAVLHSPVLYKPVEGKELVVLYLTGAAMSFVGAEATPSADDRPPRRDQADGRDDGQGDVGWDGRFRYVRKLVDTHNALLEFETTMAGKYVNGVDLIRCDDAGQVVDFKVMVRPRQAVEAVRELMAAALDTLQADPN